jgi:hypothetical protein
MDEHLKAYLLMALRHYSDVYYESAKGDGDIPDFAECERASELAVKAELFVLKAIEDEEKSCL